MEVDGMCIHAVVGDAPDLRAIRSAGDGSYIDIALGQVGRIDQLGRRVDIRDTGPHSVRLGRVAGPPHPG